MGQGLISRRGAMIGSKGGGTFFGVELPRSLYYAQAVAWVTVAEDSGGGNYPQIVCNGSLYVFTGTNVNRIDLASGAFTTEACAIPVGGVAFATDSTANIFAVSTNTIYTYNVLTKSLTSVLIRNIGNYRTVAYSHKDHALYIFGGNSSSNNTGDTRADKYDLATGAVVNLANVPVACDCGTAWVDEETGIISILAPYYLQQSPQSVSFLKFNPYTNTYTTVYTTGNGIAYPSPAINVAAAFLGEVCYLFSDVGTKAVSMQTGQYVEGQMPTAASGKIATQMASAWENKIYCANTAGFQSITFFTSPPEDAPVVCKIYQGQKFHTLVPFNIPAKSLTVTTQQQTAAQDIEIKMYDYSAEGGQVIFIET